MLDFKDQLRREKRAVESGFSTEFQVSRDLIGQAEAGGNVCGQQEDSGTNPALALMLMNQVSWSGLMSNKALGTISTRVWGTQMLGGAYG